MQSVDPNTPVRLLPADGLLDEEPIFPTFDFYFLLLLALTAIFSTVSLRGPLVLGYCLLRPVSTVQHVGFGHPFWKLVWLVLRCIGLVYGLVLTGQLVVSQWATLQLAAAQFNHRDFAGRELLLLVPIGIIVAVVLFEAASKLVKETYSSFCRRPWTLDALQRLA